MGNLSSFDATEHDPDTGYTPIPNGLYKCFIVDSILKNNSNEDGEVLKITFQVFEGPQRGRTFLENLNLKNKNQQTVRISNSKLSAICHAVNILHPDDSKDLHDKPMLVDLIVDPKNTQFNKVRSYKSITDGNQSSPDQQTMISRNQEPAGQAMPAFLRK